METVLDVTYPIGFDLMKVRSSLDKRHALVFVPFEDVDGLLVILQVI